MTKYSALEVYLRAQRRNEVPMTFAEIERLIGHKLPPSHRYRSWWSNNSFNSVMTKAWLRAGFRSASVDLRRRKLIFRRGEPMKRKKEWSEQAEVHEHPSGHEATHPVIGWLKGTVRVPPGFDLTESADPDWGGPAAG